MKILKITRTLTLTGSLTIEVPDIVSDDDILEALNDEANLFIVVESYGLSQSDMSTNPNDYSADTWEVEVVDGFVDLSRDHLPYDKIDEALADDEIECGDYVGN